MSLDQMRDTGLMLLVIRSSPGWRSAAEGHIGFSVAADRDPGLLFVAERGLIRS